MTDKALREFLKTPLSAVKNIGEKTTEALLSANITSVLDVVMHLPSGIASVGTADASAAQSGDIVALNVIPQQYRTFGPGGKYLRIHCDCHSLKHVDLVFFRVWPGMAEKQFPIDEACAIEGKLERFNDVWQMAHPKRRALPAPEEGEKEETFFYSMRGGIPGSQLARIVKHTIKEMPEGDVLPPGVGVSFRNDVTFSEAIRMLHGHGRGADETMRLKAREHAAYVEIFSHACALKLARSQATVSEGIALVGKHNMAERAREQLPFELTAGQAKAVAEITADLSRPEAMMRLLQGDVGSGKTAVAFLTCMVAIDDGYQAVIMAPTELLARQHMEAAEKIIQLEGVRPVLLTGHVKGAARRQALEDIADGRASLVIGTHALFQEAVEFHCLGYAVIDEQHRFGVGQRLALAEKSPGVNVLLMSATPIPRTLTLALYGDIAVSRLSEKPAGRQAIDTRVLSVAKLDKVAQRVINLAENGGKIYWICPLVSESEDPDTTVTAAQTRAEYFESIVADKQSVALAHGQMKPAERHAAMEAFRKGEARILVATTVIEVGVDVPDATVIVIEHAERFGLSQLHQLRGRVGRSDLASSCILLYGATGKTGFERLQAMRRCDDGFVLAEEDLRLRGSGNVLGTEQSGSARFRCADIFLHQHLFEDAHRSASACLMQEGEVYEAVNDILEMFGYERQKNLIHTG